MACLKAVIDNFELFRLWARRSGYIWLQKVRWNLNYQVSCIVIC